MEEEEDLSHLGGNDPYASSFIGTQISLKNSHTPNVVGNCKSVYSEVDALPDMTSSNQNCNQLIEKFAPRSNLFGSARELESAASNVTNPKNPIEDHFRINSNMTYTEMLLASDDFADQEIFSAGFSKLLEDSAFVQQNPLKDVGSSSVPQNSDGGINAEYSNDFSNDNNANHNREDNEYVSGYVQSSAHANQGHLHATAPDGYDDSKFEEDDVEQKKWDIFGDDEPQVGDETVDETTAEDSVEHLSQEDIDNFLENESYLAAVTSSQEVRSRHVPQMNQIFDSDEAAYSFYNQYASICGFSVLKAGTYQARSHGNTATTRYTYKCNRSGKKLSDAELEKRKQQKQKRKEEKTGVKQAENTQRRRRNTIEITGCQAKMIVSQRNDKWIVITLDLDHNHPLSPADESKYLLSHKNMTDQEKLFIRTFNSVKLPTRKIMAILSYLRGGRVPYTKKDVSNVRTAIRQENSKNDMMQVLDYFRKRQKDDPRFYYSFKLGKGNKVLSIFWSDANSRKMYDLYGDCLSFDTTYKTNKYNLPFAPFVGITGHGHNCLFACALLQNETIDTFTWLFHTFLDCMGGKQPLTIITDQCVSMRTAVPAVFTNSRHRNCFFHIVKKAEEKCTRSFATKPHLHEEFKDILKNSLTEAEFETLWVQMIQKYGVGHVKYFQAMWDYRKKFVPVYFKKSFFPFIHSTARSEGTNSVFKDNVGCTYSVISFLGESEKISKDIIEKEKNQDSITRTTTPNFWVKSELELQAAGIYNRPIFYRFQKQIMFTTKLHVDEIVKNEHFEVYKSKMLAEKEFRSRRFVVMVSLPDQLFSCICCKFEKDGIVCSHILRVLVHLNMSELPDKYFIDRWKPKEIKYLRNKQSNIPIELTSGNDHLRFQQLSDRAIEISSEGSKSNEKYLYVEKEFGKIEEGLDAMTKAEEANEQNKDSCTANTTERSDAPHPDGYGESLENPDVAPSKGRPSGPGRQKTLMETIFTKQQITCSHCGSHEHNIATCQNLHLPKSHFESSKKRKKKQTAGLQPSSQQKSPSSVRKKVAKKQAPVEL